MRGKETKKGTFAVITFHHGSDVTHPVKAGFKPDYILI